MKFNTFKRIFLTILLIFLIIVLLVLFAATDFNGDNQCIIIISVVGCIGGLVLNFIDIE